MLTPVPEQTSTFLYNFRLDAFSTRCWTENTPLRSASVYFSFVLDVTPSCTMAICYWLDYRRPYYEHECPMVTYSF